MCAEASVLPCNFGTSKVSNPAEDVERGHVEPTSSKDTLTRVQSPRTSKSSGTVVQHLSDPTQVLRERVSEECTSSAKGLSQRDGASSESQMTEREKDSGKQPSLKQGGFDSPPDLSKSSQSVQRREHLLEDAQSRQHSSIAMDHLVSQYEGEAPAAPTTAMAPKPVPCPAEQPNDQRMKHKSSKQKPKPQASELEVDLLARESSSVPNLDIRLSEAGAEAERDLLQDSQCAIGSTIDNGSLSRVCSTAAAAHIGRPPRETDAASPAEFPQFQRKQRSNLGKRGRQAFKTPGRISTAEEPGSAKAKQSGGSRKSHSAWGSDLKGASAAADDDYIPPGCQGDIITPEIRSQRSSRSRLKNLPSAEQDDGSLLEPQRSTGYGNRFQDSVPSFGALSTTPSRSTRSQPQDLSCLWKSHFPTVQTAKRLRGFGLTAALGKLDELSSRDHQRLSRECLNSSPEDAQLRSRVFESLEREKVLRDSLANYLTKSEPPVKHDRLDTAQKFTGHPLGKILQATSPSQATMGKPGSEDGINLPLDQMLDAFVQPHLREWESILRQGDCPMQSSLRKRQRADVEHCWEDFYESQALEQSVLSELHEWLQPGS